MGTSVKFAACPERTVRERFLECALSMRPAYEAFVGSDSAFTTRHLESYAPIRQETQYSAR